MIAFKAMKYGQKYLYISYMQTPLLNMQRACYCTKTCTCIVRVLYIYLRGIKYTSMIQATSILQNTVTLYRVRISCDGVILKVRTAMGNGAGGESTRLVNLGERYP